MKKKDEKASHGKVKEMKKETIWRNRRKKKNLNLNLMEVLLSDNTHVH